jgi:carboxyl-terminal processing protease
MKYAAVLLATLLLVACSRQQPPEPAPEFPRPNLDHYLVQNRGDDADTAAKATRESLLLELDALMQRLAEAQTLPAAFRIAEGIEDLGREVAPQLQERVPKLPPLPRIAGWRAVWTLGTLDNGGWDAGVYGLLDMVIEDGDRAHRVAAAEVLGAVASTRHEARLNKALTEEVFDPEVRVQLAVALWRSSRDTTATRVLNEMLASDNDSFRIQAALALGEINQLTADSKPVLERLADEPTMRGRVARRALDYERAIQRFEAALMGRVPGQPRREEIDLTLLDNLERMIQERYIYPDAVSGRKLLYAAASGMLAELDPYTCLLEDSQVRDAGDIRRFAVPTLGLMLGSARVAENRELRLTQVLSVKPGSPAQRAGLRAGDRIYRVLRGVTPEQVRRLRADSEDLRDPETPFQWLPLDDAISQFQGGLGTTLGLQISREGWLLGRWVHVTHEEPSYETISHELLPGGIGMVQIVELNAGSPVRVKDAVGRLAEGGASALILDLRNCAGGNVEAATQVASLFLPRDTLVTYSMGRSEQLAPRTEYRTQGDEPDTTTPLVVLVNGGTADAGEVLAGALREHERARVAGEKTFGRAIVQELIPITARELEEDERSAALLLTVARYHGPVSGMVWYDRGVEPDAPLAPRLFEGWIYDQFEYAQAHTALTDYLTALLEETEADTLLRLARGDNRDVTAWPGLDGLYRKLDLQLEKEDLRYLVRREVRARLTEQGKDVGQVDLQEDSVFTGAVKEAARLAAIDLSEIPEYAVLSR